MTTYVTETGEQQRMGRKRRTAFIAAKREERLAHGTPQGTLTALIACIMYILDFTTNEIKKRVFHGEGSDRKRNAIAIMPS